MTATPQQQANQGRRVDGARDGGQLFADYAARVRPHLETALRGYLDGVERANRHLPQDVQASVETVRDLSLRGGKRLRAVLLAAGYEASGGPGGPDAVVMAGVSLELLQTYLLIHDDWMDADDVRRGGPSVPAMLRKQFEGRGAGGRTADAFTILAGDFAAGLALDALGLASPRRSARWGASSGTLCLGRCVIWPEKCQRSPPRRRLSS